MSQIPPPTTPMQANAARREALAGLRLRTTDHLQAVLARVFARADDWLFDLAKKDASATASPYLHAMRALRTSRAPIERGFREHLDKGFERFERRAAPEPGAPPPTELSLLDTSELEQQLAANMTAEAVMRAHGPQLDELTGRLCAMLGVTELDKELNPLSAHQMAVALAEAQRDVDMPPDVRMVLAKYYERELIHDLRDLLTELNRRLAMAGFNPVNLPPPKPQARPEAGGGYGAPAPGGYGDAPAGAGAGGGGQGYYGGPPMPEDRAMFDALVHALRALRPERGGAAPGPDGKGAGYIGHTLGRSADQRPMVAQEMLSVLSLMQSNVPEAVNEALERPDASLALLLKNELLRSASRIGLPPEQVAIGPEDEDAVDLVGMLFDVMFEERDFEHGARQLISRLVVPFVKAAVMDRRLFMYKTHPARRLLNSLAEAVEGNRGDGPQERELLQKAEGTVDRLVAEFNEDLAIFETLEQELRAFLEQHRRRVELAERRAAEAQRGQERLEQARDLASKELERRTAGLRLTPAMQDFLSRTWTHHLSMIALREGPDSSSWQAALGVADRLLGLLPREGEPARAVAPALQPLREPLENVLASSGIIGEAAQEAIRAIAESLEHPERDVPAPAAIAPPPEDKVVPLPERRSAASVTAALADLKPRLEIIGGKTDLKFNPEDAELLRQLKIGTWIHVAGEDGKHHPVKLSWISPISSRLMFVNRRGVRVLVASVEELAAMKLEGNLLVREQEGVFDQVLHRVMGKLKEESH